MEVHAKVILSPHCDDAVLSCWHLLSDPGPVEVVNVFAGSPPAGRVYWWDRITHATDSAERMRERHAEDREALGLAHRRATNLDFLDEQYEPSGQSVDAIAARIEELVPDSAELVAPAGLGKTADHHSVRDAALALRARGRRVSLYADHPHAVALGWPKWVNGAVPSVDAAALWEHQFEQAGVEPTTPSVHHLDKQQKANKLAAVTLYATQLPALEAAYGHIAGFPVFPHEVVWELR